MKRVLSLLAAASLMAMAATAMASTITNSKHNLSSTGASTTGLKGTTSDSNQICVYCHTPHNANPSMPLWNRSNPAGTLFTLYSGVNMTNVSYKTGLTSDSISLFCLSCHDGNTNFNNVHNAPSDGVPLFDGSITSGHANFGRNLSNSHPINFAVDGTLNTGNDLHLLGTGATKMGKALGPQFPLFRTTRNGNVSNTLECSSCHAVHDMTNTPFLRYTMAGSQLCLGCHNK